ncbi:MAG: hypothetical protein KBF88_07400 [Polyangiaceae bacterium]|nr:hypothetical protein [Polyangiaceae bacterium]
MSAFTRIQSVLGKFGVSFGLALALPGFALGCATANNPEDLPHYTAPQESFSDEEVYQDDIPPGTRHFYSRTYIESESGAALLSEFMVTENGAGFGVRYCNAVDGQLECSDWESVENGVRDTTLGPAREIWVTSKRDGEDRFVSISLGNERGNMRAHADCLVVQGRVDLGQCSAWTTSRFDSL